MTVVLHYTVPMENTYRHLSVDDLINGLAPGSNCVLVDVQAALIVKGAAAVPALIDALGHTDIHIAANAAAVLGKLGDRRAVDPLLTLLSDFEWTLREQAALALGRIGQPQALPALQDALHDDVRSVRRAATQAIRQITDPDRNL